MNGLAYRALEQIEDWAAELVAEAPVARLGLLDDGDLPRVLPVTFAIAGAELWSAIDNKPKRPGVEPARLRFVRRRPEVALTVDRYEDDWSRLAWVQVLGRARVVEIEADEAGAPLAALASKYEPYETEEPPGPLIAIEPERVIAWRA